MLAFHIQRIEEMKVSNKRVVFLNKIVNYVYKTASEKKFQSSILYALTIQEEVNFVSFGQLFFHFYKN